MRADVPASDVQWIATLGDGGPYVAALIEAEAEMLPAILGQIADLPGRIVPCHIAPYAGAWLLEEVSISTNTTAAGGNASLMALS